MEIKKLLSLIGVLVATGFYGTGLKGAAAPTLDKAVIDRSLNYIYTKINQVDAALEVLGKSPLKVNQATTKLKTLGSLEVLAESDQTKALESIAKMTK